jgi:7-cyano-7-deazaguanine synthase
MSKKILILLSGGADSILLCELANMLGYDITTVTFNYGQKHIGEVIKANNYSLSRGFRSIVLDVKNAFFQTKAKLLQEQEEYKNVSPYYVPARNAIFLSIAYSYAESNGIDRIWIGCQYDDFINRFPDCTQEFISSINETLNKGTSKKVIIEAPLLGFMKDTVIELISYFGVEKSEIFSGYGGL